MHGMGVCMATGWACMAGGHVWQEACMAGETATAMDGTHPTGMHSCSNIIINRITLLHRSSFIGRSEGSPTAQIFLNLAKSYVGAPWRVGAPSENLDPIP